MFPASREKVKLTSGATTTGTYSSRSRVKVSYIRKR
ncbi:unnamed protein product [Amoebophrya sp. A120]|nr:unnamed protein product [Amoebophrya sp. A120]|eukprot:GSA120T00014224001.1